MRKTTHLSDEPEKTVDSYNEQINKEARPYTAGFFCYDETKTNYVF